MKLKPCGTSAAYFRHIRRGEPTCEPCMKAEALRRRQYPRKAGGQRSWTMRDEVTDWLFLDGGWLTVAGIAGRFDRHPDSVWRVLRQLEGEGLVERRVVELAGFDDQRTEWKLT